MHIDNPAGHHLSGQSVPPPPSAHHFYAGYYATTFPFYPGLGQAPSMPGCIPRGLVAYPVIVTINVTYLINNELKFKSEVTPDKQTDQQSALRHCCNSDLHQMVASLASCLYHMMGAACRGQSHLALSR